MDGRIDRLVYALYGLSEDEIRIVESYIVDMYDAVHSLLYRVSLYNSPHRDILQHDAI
jgi:hypothetical protein